MVFAGIGSFFAVGGAAAGGTTVAGWWLAPAARKVIHVFNAVKAVVRPASVARWSATGHALAGR